MYHNTDFVFQLSEESLAPLKSTDSPFDPLKSVPIRSAFWKLVFTKYAWFNRAFRNVAFLKSDIVISVFERSESDKSAPIIFVAAMTAPDRVTPRKFVLVDFTSAHYGSLLFSLAGL